MNSDPNTDYKRYYKYCADELPVHGHLDKKILWGDGNLVKIQINLRVSYYLFDDFSFPFYYSLLHEVHDLNFSSFAFELPELIFHDVFHNDNKHNISAPLAKFLKNTYFV